MFIHTRRPRVISKQSAETRSYNDPRHESFGALRVLNEDRVAARTGFGTHSHQHYEIFSYVIDGQLEQYVSPACRRRDTSLISRAAKTPWATPRSSPVGHSR